MGGGGGGGQSQPVWHLGHSQSLSCPSLILLGPGGNNAPIDVHTPRDNISVSPGTGAKQVSLWGLGACSTAREAGPEGWSEGSRGQRSPLETTAQRWWWPQQEGLGPDFWVGQGTHFPVWMEPFSALRGSTGVPKTQPLITGADGVGKKTQEMRTNPLL